MHIFSIPKLRPRDLVVGLLIIWIFSFQAQGQSAAAEAIQKTREQRDSTIWKDERLAQDYETAFIKLWDDLRACGNLFQPLKDFRFESIERPNFSSSRKIIEDIEIWNHEEAPGPLLSRNEFVELLEQFESKGYEIDQTEWHHSKFSTQENGPPQSEFSFALHAKGPGPAHQRYILKGSLDVLWSDRKTLGGVTLPDQLGFKELTVMTRSLPAAFDECLWLESEERKTPYSIVNVQDLDGDGLADIVFPKANEIYYNDGNFSFSKTMLSKFPIKGQITAAIIVDLNLDGLDEYVVAIYGAPFLFAYTFNPETRQFDGKPFGIWKSESPLVVHLIAAGDLTGDGFPELYLGPSTPAYEDGLMPTPYFDANDGKPAFLLRNRGGLIYEDISEMTDVAKKRGRRAYVASMLDLNADRRMDFVVTSDFSGIDFYENTGGGLRDRTDEWVDDRSLFGMSQSFADFDRDGTLDILAVGMSSTTARRLERMGLGREEFPEHQQMRMRIAYGNRLYFGNGQGSFRQQPASEDTARSGWSWGSSALDFNNDGYPDIFIANGYLSKETARDYCSTFWTHDIYIDSSQKTSQLNEYFDIFGPKALVGGNQMGWNPFEKDHLYLNLSGEEFVNVAYLFGVSNGGDGRAVVGEDFDKDGRVDLLLVEQDSMKASERVYLYRNQLESDGKWIGLNLSASPGDPIIGTSVRLITEDFQTEDVYTVGEAYSAQTPPNFHFGLGDSESVLKFEIRWPNGSVTEVENPDTGRYHAISSAGR